MLTGTVTEKKVIPPKAEITNWKLNAWDKGRSLSIAITFVDITFTRPGYLELMLPTLPLTPDVSYTEE